MSSNFVGLRIPLEHGKTTSAFGHVWAKPHSATRSRLTSDRSRREVLLECQRKAPILARTSILFARTPFLPCIVSRPNQFPCRSETQHRVSAAILIGSQPSRRTSRFDVARQSPRCPHLRSGLKVHCRTRTDLVQSLAAENIFVLSRVCVPARRGRG